MAEIEKEPAKIRKSKYRAQVVRRRKNDLALAALGAELDAQRRINRYSRPNKLEKYEQDLDLFDKIGPSKRDVTIRSRPLGWGNKRLKIDKDGAFTRERGRLRKTRKSLSRDTESGAVVGRYEKESFRKKTTESYRARGLLSKNVKRKDGSYEENWELLGGKLVRTKYFTSRVRDGGLFRSISENLSDVDANGYRTLTRNKDGLFKSKKVFETDENGKIQELVGRQSRTFMKYSSKSKNRDFADVDIRHFGGLFSKSYSSRLDADGNAISKDISARRKLLSKRSFEFTGKDELNNQLGAQLKSASHSFGLGKLKLYKRSVDYDYTVGDGVKTVKKKLFGLTIYHDTVNQSSNEITANDLRKKEAQVHSDLWKSEVARREAAQTAAVSKSTITVHPVPTPGTIRRLAPPVLSKPSVARGQSPFASGVEFPTTLAPSNERGPHATQNTPQASGLVKINSAAALAPENEEDEESAFLKSFGPATPSKTVSPPVDKSTDRDVNALLAGWSPVEDNDTGKTKAPSSRSSVKSASGSSVALNPDDKDLSKSFDADRGNRNSKGKDAAARRGYERNDHERVSFADW